MVRVVPALDEAGDRELCLGLRAEATPLQEFALECCKEALSHRVIMGVADRAHQRSHAHLPTALPERRRCVLTAMIEVMGDTSGSLGSSLLECHVERVEHDFGPEMRRHRPADDPATEGVEHYGEIQKSGPCRHIRDVSDPEFVRCTCSEIALNEISCNDFVRVSARGVHATTAMDATMPISRIRRATRFWLTRSPASRRSSQIRDAPYVPSEHS